MIALFRNSKFKLFSTIFVIFLILSLTPGTAMAYAEANGPDSNGNYNDRENIYNPTRNTTVENINNNQPIFIEQNIDSPTMNMISSQGYNTDSSGGWLGSTVGWMKRHPYATAAIVIVTLVAVGVTAYYTYNYYFKTPTIAPASSPVIYGVSTGSVEPEMIVTKVPGMGKVHKLVPNPKASIYGSNIVTEAIPMSQESEMVLARVSGNIHQLVPKTVSQVINDPLTVFQPFNGEGQRLGGSIEPLNIRGVPAAALDTINKYSPIKINPVSLNVFTSAQSVPLPNNPTIIHTLTNNLPSIPVLGSNYGFGVNTGTQTITLTVTKVQQGITQLTNIVKSQPSTSIINNPSPLNPKTSINTLLWLPCYKTPYINELTKEPRDKWGLKNIETFKYLPFTELNSINHIILSTPFIGRIQVNHAPQIVPNGSDKSIIRLIHSVEKPSPIHWSYPDTCKEIIKKLEKKAERWWRLHGDEWLERLMLTKWKKYVSTTITPQDNAQTRTPIPTETVPTTPANTGNAITTQQDATAHRLVLNSSHPILDGTQTIRGIPLANLETEFGENTGRVLDWLNNLFDPNFVRMPSTFDMTYEQLNKIRTQVRQHYWGHGLLGGMQNGTTTTTTTTTTTVATAPPAAATTTTATTATTVTVAANNDPPVMITDAAGHPINLEEFILNPARSHGQYMTIIQGLTALRHLDPTTRYIITVRGGYHHEYIRVPNGLNIEFRADTPAVIDGILVEPGAQVTFHRNIKFSNIIRGNIQPVNDHYNTIRPSDAPICGEVCELLRPRLLTHHLTRHHLITTEYITTELIELLDIINDTTHNSMLQVRIGILRRQLENVRTETYEQLNRLPRYEGVELDMFYQMENDPETLRLVQLIDTPMHGVPDGVRQFCRDHIVTGNMFTHVGLNAQPGNAAYVTFLHDIMHLMNVLMDTNHNILGNFGRFLTNHANYCMHTTPFNRINNGFQEARSQFHQIEIEINHPGTPSTVLAGPTTSSQQFLSFAQTELNNPEHRLLFREALIQLLNKKVNAKLESTSTDEELLSWLRYYTKNCPDAEYAIVRWKEDYKHLILVWSVIGGAIIGAAAYIAKTLWGLIWPK